MKQESSVRGSHLSKRGFNGNQLKLIAVVSMLIDHMGVLFVGQGILQSPLADQKEYASWYLLYCVMRIAGRIAFPIYAFLITEGFFHTRDWKRYALRLGIFALISEIPFDLLAWQQPIDWRVQNVFFTLLLGLLMLKALESVGQCAPAQNFTSFFLSGMVPQYIVVCAFCVLAWLLRTDYDYEGILLIAVFYWFRQNPQKMCLMGFVWMTVMTGSVVFMAGLAPSFWLISRYDGTRGADRGKYFFYLFYPVHLLALYVIYRILF